MKVHCSHDALVAISDLKTNPKNRNKHPDDQISRLAKILDYQGFRYPVKVSKRSGFVTSGHGRILAAQANGWTEVPVNFQDYESDDQEYADTIADNSIASWSELDRSGINGDLKDFDPSFELDMLGFENFVLDPSELGPMEPLPESRPTELEPLVYILCPNCMTQFEQNQARKFTVGEQ